MVDYRVNSNVIIDGKKICIDDLPEAEQVTILTGISLAAGRRYAEGLGIEIMGEKTVSPQKLFFSCKFDKIKIAF